MPQWSTIFPQSAPFDPAGAIEAFCKAVPARHVVYLLTDEADRPVQLLCVKNLRASLRRRLGTEEIQASRRINYRELVRRVYWVRIDSTFEADWLYTEAVTACFPASAEQLMGFRSAWFINVDLASPHPRYTRSTQPTPSGRWFGPLAEKGHATRLTELLEDAFDLCRYPQELLLSPVGKACAYKEMHKCPAPCDGSISLEQYHSLVQLSVQAMLDPADMIRQQDLRMRQAAAELKFELAGRIKQYVEQLGQLGQGDFRFVRPIERFGFVALQRGPTPRSAKVFLISPGQVEPLLVLLSHGDGISEALTAVLHRIETPAPLRIDEVGVRRIAMVAAHLFATKNTSGVFIPLDQLDDQSFAKAYQDLQKQAAPLDEAGEEGIVKELIA